MCIQVDEIRTLYAESIDCVLPSDIVCQFDFYSYLYMSLSFLKRGDFQMGMECSAIHVMLLTQNDEIVSWNLDLANEMQADLVGNADLFLSFSNAGTFAGCIGKGFKDYYEEEPSKKNFIKQYCDDFYENGYKELQKKLRLLLKILMLNLRLKKWFYCQIHRPMVAEITNGIYLTYQQIHSNAANN